MNIYCLFGRVSIEADVVFFGRICYSKHSILEVFAVYDATNTFDLVAFFSRCDLLRF